MILSNMFIQLKLSQWGLEVFTTVLLVLALYVYVPPQLHQNTGAKETMIPARSDFQYISSICTVPYMLCSSASCRVTNETSSWKALFVR
jgi:hypothetical protein